jgi:thiol-disulfide isomerase/thioredoxin
MDIIELESREDLKKYLENTTCDTTILKFTASWCKPCKTIAPFVESMNDEYFKKGINFEFIEIDVDCALDLYAFLKKTKMINGIPALLAYKKSLYNPESFFVPFKNATGADKTLVSNFYKESLGN